MTIELVHAVNSGTMTLAEANAKQAEIDNAAKADEKKSAPKKVEKSK